MSHFVSQNPHLKTTQYYAPARIGWALSVGGSRLSVRLSVCLSILSREWNGIGRFVYDFCILTVDNESAHLAYSLLELTFVRSLSSSIKTLLTQTVRQWLMCCALLNCI